ncbi:hypothetical protein BDC45DRAFT_525832, partial [Circinella umbellata]
MQIRKEIGLVMYGTCVCVCFEKGNIYVYIFLREKCTIVNDVDVVIEVIVI